MKSMINENVLIQIEMELDKNGKSMFRIVTFFRHSHRVNVTKWYKSYEVIKEIFDEMIKAEYEF